MAEYFRQKVKRLTLQALAKAGWAIFTTAVVIAAASTTIWLMAAFTEPTAGPASSDQDFAQNVMGANNANNDFDSSSVAANADGSIIERIEYLIDYLVNGGAVCGNGVVEIGEGCDDGGTSWTSGACAGDCSRRNYWSNPSMVGSHLFTRTQDVDMYCAFMNFGYAISYLTQQSASSYSSGLSTRWSTHYISSGGLYNTGWRNSYDYINSWTATYNEWIRVYVTIASTTEIWCAD